MATPAAPERAYWDVTFTVIVSVSEDIAPGEDTAIELAHEFLCDRIDELDYDATATKEIS